MNQPKVVHLITPYLFHTGSWIYSQLTGLQNLSNYVFTQRKENIQQFPFDFIYSLDDLRNYEKFLTKAYRKFGGDHYGLFFSKYLKQIKPDIFHAHMGYEAVRWFNFVKRSKIPLVTTFYGLDVSKLGRIPYWREKYQSVFEYGKYFLAEGSFLKSQIEILGCPTDKILVQRLGINLKEYTIKDHDMKNDGNEITLIQVSTFREKKGIEYSLRALRILKSKYPQIRFNIIGQGDDEVYNKRISKLILELELNNNVKLLGIKSHFETIQEMLKADIFVHPSITAHDGDNEGGAPVGIIEASSIGLPVISSYHADIPEVICAGVTGLLSKERDFEDLAKNIEYLIKLPEKRKQFGLAGREHIKKNYNLTDQIESLEKIYLMAIND